MDRTTLATNLKPLEREGLLAIAPAEDRRARNIQITDLGRKHYDEAIPLWASVQAQFEAAYGDAQATKLRKSLATVLGTGFEPGPNSWAEDSSSIGPDELMGLPFCALLGLTNRSICTYIRKRENAPAYPSFVVGEGKTAAGHCGFVD
jgi:hypothetical protein